MFSGFSFLLAYEALNKHIFSMRRRSSIGLSLNGIRPHYQPIVDLKSGKVVGCELLARFKDKIGPLYPDEFIPVVSELDQSWKMTKFLILQAKEYFKNIQAADIPFYLSINIFPKDINNGNIIKGIKLLNNISPNHSNLL